jgi:hypothetical protein
MQAEHENETRRLKEIIWRLQGLEAERAASEGTA